MFFPLLSPCSYFYLPIGSGQTCSKIPSWMENALNAKIINGQFAPSPIPWQVHIHISITGKGSFRCGGTILDEETILSAAHCFIFQGETIQY